MAAVRDGRWFWWVLAGCVLVLGADVAGLGPFAGDADDRDLRTEIEVLGDTVEREPLTTTTSVLPASTTTTTLSEAEALERLDGLDQETLDALEEIKGVDPADLVPPTTAR